MFCFGELRHLQADKVLEFRQVMGQCAACRNSTVTPPHFGLSSPKSWTGSRQVQTSFDPVSIRNNSNCCLSHPPQPRPPEHVPCHFPPPPSPKRSLNLILILIPVTGMFPSDIPPQNGVPNPHWSSDGLLSLPVVGTRGKSLNVHSPRARNCSNPCRIRKIVNRILSDNSRPFLFSTLLSRARATL